MGCGKVIAVVLGFALPGVSLAAADYTVEPGGLELGRALELIRAERAAGDVSVKTVAVRGVNRLTEPVIFTEQDCNLRFVGEDGAAFSGGMEIKDWREIEPGVWEADAPSDASGGPMYFNQLWVNGRRADCARLPDKGWLEIKSASQKVAGVAGGVTNYIERVAFSDDAVKALAALGPGDLRYIEVGVINKWSYGVRTLESYDPAKNEISMVSPFVWKSWKKWLPGNVLAAFFNVRTAFDAPGEWFLDMAAGKVRYRPLPGENVPELSFVAPRRGMSRLLVFRGGWRGRRFVRNVSFRNISFEHTAAPMDANRPRTFDHHQAASGFDGAVTAEGVCGLDFDFCRIARTGNYAMRFNSACVSNRIADCTFEDLGAGGIWMGADFRFRDKLAEIPRGIVKPDRLDSTAFNLISNCTVRCAGRYNPEGTAVALTHCSDTKVVHCDIHDIMYTGISVGWVWGYFGSVAQRNEIAFNRIWDLGKGVMSDMGGIYMLGTSFGTVVHDNVISNVHSYAYGGWGLYADEGSEGIVFERNLCRNLTDGGFHQHFGTGCIVRNNIFCGVEKTGAVRASRAEMFGVPSTVHFVGNIVCTDSAPLCGGGVFKTGGVWANNLWWDSRGESAARFGGKTWKEWKQSARESGGVFADPLFYDMKAGDFRLRPGSPAIGIGFRPFDASRAGRRTPDGKVGRDVVEHAVRGGAGHALEKLRRGGPFTVAYFGGSITEAGEAVRGWRGRTTEWLRKSYPQSEIREVNAAIGGTDSTLGAYRLEHDVLRHRPDLIFVEFACNDMALEKTEDSLAAMESIVRQTWKRDPKTDIVFAYTVTVRMTNDYLHGRCHRILDAHQRIADRYRIASVDFAPRVIDRLKNGTLLMKASDFPTPVPKEDPEYNQKVRKAQKGWSGILFSNDGIHPRAEGHALYFESLTNLFASAGMEKKCDHAAVLGKAMFPEGGFADAKMVQLSPAFLSGEWHAVTNGSPHTGSFSARTGSMYETDKPGSKLRFRFAGDRCALYLVYGPDCGRIRISVDGRPVSTHDLFDRYCTYYRLTTVPIAVSGGVHDVEIELLDKQPDRRLVFRYPHSPASLAHIRNRMAEGRYDGRRFAVGAILSSGSVRACGVSPFCDRQLAAPKEPEALSWKFIEELKLPEKNPAPPPGTRPGDLKTPWLSNRISRCYFSPVKRAPYWRDELADDVDYYPDAYLERLRNEGVNGLWISGRFRELAETSFTKRDALGLKRLKKLSRVVEKCKRHGIRIWLFGIEPECLKPGDPLLREHPEFAGSGTSWIDWKMMCPSEPGVLRYLEESTYDIFRQVPDLAGLLLITNGEGLTTCLSCRHVTGEEPYSEHFTCERCRSRPNRELHTVTVSAMLKGMRRANPKAELLSWFYQPQATPHRLGWVHEAVRDLPEGVSLIYNFESGGMKLQSGRWRCGGDYWLSYPGPSLPFTGVANAARASGARIGAKIQTANSHECASVPYIPAPGLLYRKMKAMKQAGVSDVMMCWFFGNYPGIMNRTVGKLAYSDFKESEEEFLEHLAEETWGGDGKIMGRLWRDFTEGFSCYPFSNVMQYYGPFHHGIAWPLLAKVELGRLSHTWVPGEPPSGDLIGEALQEFTIDEAIVQSEKMVHKCSALDENGVDLLEGLSAKYAGDRERTLDIGVMKMLRALFRSGHDIFRFYRLRSDAIALSRIRRDFEGARAAVREMRAIAERQRALTKEILPLTKADSRLGFHSEAQDYKFWPELLEWRIAQMDVTMRELDGIEDTLSRKEGYPESELEKNAPKAVVDGPDITASNVVFRLCRTAAGDLEIHAKAAAGQKHVVVGTVDAAGVAHPVHVFVPRPGLDERIVTFPAGTDAATAKTSRNPDGTWNFTVRFRSSGWGGDDRLRPGWIALIDDDFPQTVHPNWIWPRSDTPPKTRLCIPWFLARGYGRILWR